MSRQIFINLAVKDLNKTKGFFTSLGFVFNEDFSGDDSVGMIVNDNAFVMFSTETFFKTFIKKDLADPAKELETALAISAETKEEVDEIVNKAVAAGGTVASDATDDEYMYNRGFYDLDGHQWEMTYMKPAATP